MKPLALAGLALALFNSCTSPTDEPSTAPRRPTRTSIRWQTVAPPSDPTLSRAPAVVRAPHTRGEVAAEVSVRIVRLHHAPGDTVEVRTPIVDVSSPEWAAAAATLAGTATAIELYRSRLRELDTLSKDGLVSRNKLFELKSKLAELEAEQLRARTLLHQAGIDAEDIRRLRRTGTATLRAPVGGVVSMLDAHPGQVRDPSRGPIAVIIGGAASGGTRIESRLLAPWPSGAELVFVTTTRQAISLSRSPLASARDPEDGTTLTWYGPAEEELGLADGLLGSVQLVSAPGVWEVPSGALVRRDNRWVLYRQRSGDVSEIEVTPVATSGAASWVRATTADGLAAEDQIAEDGRIAQGEIDA